MRRDMGVQAELMMNKRIHLYCVLLSVVLVFGVLVLLRSTHRFQGEAAKPRA
jgi:hypothetical protein